MIGCMVMSRIGKSDNNNLKKRCITSVAVAIFKLCWMLAPDLNGGIPTTENIHFPKYKNDRTRNYNVHTDTMKYCPFQTNIYSLVSP